MEKETDSILPFLDVKIEKDTDKILTSVYRKPTFIGQYTRWEMFGPSKCETNLIGTLVHKGLKFCSKNKLQQEFDYIRSIIRDNGYPENIINSSISKKITQLTTKRMTTKMPRLLTSFLDWQRAPKI